MANKLNHHDLYVTSPETEEVEVIDNIKKLLRNGEYDDEEMLDHLWMQSTNVLCQLMKDFFDDSKVKIFEAERFDSFKFKLVSINFSVIQ